MPHRFLSFRFFLTTIFVGVAFSMSCQHVYVVPTGKNRVTKKETPRTDVNKTIVKEAGISHRKDSSERKESLGEWLKRNQIADNLTAGLTIGTTGLGLEVATPVTRWVSLRLGVEGIPQFRLPLDFTISSYADGQVSDNFDRIKDFMFEVTGEEMKEKVTMNCRPKMIDFKMLVDIYPFQENRHWHVTAGFYAGSGTLGSAINSKDATKSLIAMNIYNRFYDRMEKFNYEDEPFYGDVYLTKESYEEFMSFGRLGIHLGTRKDGKPYYLTPKSNATVTAKARINVFKPYLGIGYSGAVDKAQRWNVGFEAGAMFWGGAPQVYVNEDVNLNRDLTNVRGRVGDYLKVVKALPVYPVVNFKISYTFF